MKCLVLHTPFISRKKLPFLALPSSANLTRKSIASSLRCREIPRFGYGTVRIQASNVSIGSGGYDERNENGSEQNFSNDSFRSNTPSEISDIKKPPTEIPYPLLIALVLFGCGMVFSLIAFTKGGPSSILAAIAKSGFTAAFMLIFVSEIGDKTFFIAALLAMQYKKALVLLGSMGALSLMTILSVVIGRIFHSVPAQFHTTLPIGEYAAVTLLLIFGIKSIKDAWDLPSGYEGGTLGNADAEITLESYIKEEGHKTDVNMTSEGCDNNDVIVNHTRNSADLLGAFNSHPICCNRKFSLSNGANKFDSTPHLDLSLRGSSSSRFENRVIEKRTTLGNSNASAFTQYINRSLLPSSTTENACDQEKECRGNDEKHIADVVSGYNYNYGTLASALNMQKGTTTLASDQSYHSKIVLSCSQQEEFPIPVPLSFHMGFGTILPPIFPSQSVEYNKSEQLYKPCCQKANVIRDQTVQKKEQKLGCIEDQTNISSATDRSGCSSSSLCNGTGSHINSMGGFGSACVSSSNIDQVAIGQFDSVNKNQENFIAQDGNSHWSVQREAALRKFRMKRKDRCFEKKVRYESRKKLADQRPRVKGQFVRRQGHVSAFLVANRW